MQDTSKELITLIKLEYDSSEALLSDWEKDVREKIEEFHKFVELKEQAGKDEELPPEPFNYKRLLIIIGIIIGLLLFYEVFLKKLQDEILYFIVHFFHGGSLLTLIFLTLVIFIMSIFPIPGLGIISTIVAFLIKDYIKSFLVLFLG